MSACRSGRTHAGRTAVAARVSARRGFAIIAVMVLIGVGLFIATALLVRTQAEIAGATAATESTSRRAIAWSALQAVGAELHAQRRVILDGDSPRLDGQIVLFETGSVASVARLLPIGPEGVRLVAENGKIDVNTATVEMFVASGLMNRLEATALATYRGTRPDRRLRSLDELVDVGGDDGSPIFDPQRVFGALERVAEQDAGVAAFDRFEGGDLTSGEPALVDHLTVFSFEPELQRDGVLRIDVSQPWSDELGRRLDRRFGDGTGQAVRQVKESNELASRADIVRVLRFFNVANGDWVDVLDGLTGGAGDWRAGRLDLNTATRPALLALLAAPSPSGGSAAVSGDDEPAADSDSASDASDAARAPIVDDAGSEDSDAIAADILDRRDGLGSDVRGSIVWPVIEECLDGERFESIADRCTTRSWMWRVRIAVGTVPVDEPDGPLEQPSIIEAVVDLSGPSLRFAQIRDVTQRALAARLLGDVEELPALESDEGRERDDALADVGSGESFFSEFESAADVSEERRVADEVSDDRRVGGRDRSVGSGDTGDRIVGGRDSARSDEAGDASGTSRSRGGSRSGSGGAPETRPGGRWSPR